MYSYTEHSAAARVATGRAAATPPLAPPRDRPFHPRSRSGRSPPHSHCPPSHCCSRTPPPPPPCRRIFTGLAPMAESEPSAAEALKTEGNKLFQAAGLAAAGGGRVQEPLPSPSRGLPAGVPLPRGSRKVQRCHRALLRGAGPPHHDSYPDPDSIQSRWQLRRLQSPPSSIARGWLSSLSPWRGARREVPPPSLRCPPTTPTAPFATSSSRTTGSPSPTRPSPSSSTAPSSRRRAAAALPRWRVSEL